MHAGGSHHWPISNGWKCLMSKPFVFWEMYLHEDTKNITNYTELLEIKFG